MPATLAFHTYFSHRSTWHFSSSVYTSAFAIFAYKRKPRNIWFNLIKFEVFTDVLCFLNTIICLKLLHKNYRKDKDKQFELLSCSESILGISKNLKPSEHMANI